MVACIEITSYLEFRISLRTSMIGIGAFNADDLLMISASVVEKEISICNFDCHRNRHQASKMTNHMRDHAMSRCGYPVC